MAFASGFVDVCLLPSPSRTSGRPPAHANCKRRKLLSRLFVVLVDVVVWVVLVVVVTNGVVGVVVVVLVVVVVVVIVVLRVQTFAVGVGVGLMPELVSLTSPHFAMSRACVSTCLTCVAGLVSLFSSESNLLTFFIQKVFLRWCACQLRQLDSKSTRTSLHLSTYR